jgi:uncharacterized RDD family membrane protein YckC
MNWYYAVGGQQQGPIDDNQLDAMVRSGQISSDTLVWREGMANWQPLRDVRPRSSPSATVTPSPGSIPPASGAAPSPNEVVCAECGRIFAKENTIQYGTSSVCEGCKPIFLQRLREGATAPSEMRFAGFWIRFAAKFIDLVIMGILIFIPAMILGVGTSLAGGQGNAPQINAAFVVLQAALWVFDIGFRIIYNGFFVGKYGATPGKMVCGVKVVMADGQPVKYGRAFGRGAAELINAFTCLIGYIIAAFDAEKRALHDHICQTRVVYK